MMYMAQERRTRERCTPMTGSGVGGRAALGCCTGAAAGVRLEAASASAGCCFACCPACASSAALGGILQAVPAVSMQGGSLRPRR